MLGVMLRQGASLGISQDDFAKGATESKASECVCTSRPIRISTRSRGRQDRRGNAGQEPGPFRGADGIHCDRPRRIQAHYYEPE